MPPTSEQLWDAIERLAHEDGTADRIFPSVVAKLIEFKSEYGQKCYGIFESGDDSMTEIDDMAFLEFQQSQQQQ
jgi:hypothetical protein